MRLAHASKSDRGILRTRHEDACLSLVPPAEGLRQKGAIFVIADGLGGLPDGDRASLEAVREVGKLFETEPAREARRWITGAFFGANAKIRALNRDRSPANRMATTLTVAWFRDNRLFVGHVGDCRVYRLREGRIQRLTEDHALDRRTLTRVVGLESDAPPDLWEGRLRESDQYLLCSDGLHGVLGDEEIQETLMALEPQAACERLVALANAQGGPDNITVQVIRVAELER